MALPVLAIAVSFLPAAAAATCNPVPHGPILVSSDRDFTAANGVVSGSGTSTDPFLFNNLQLNDLTPGFGLKVDNSKGTITKFFNINCIQSTFTDAPPSGSILVWLLNVHTSTTVSQVNANSGRSAGSAGIRVESSSSITLDSENLNKFAADGIALISSDHITVTNSKSKALTNGVLVQDSHDIQIGQPCSLSAGTGCNEFTYDDGWGVRVVNSFNVTIVGTKGNANDTGGFLLNGAGTHNVQITGSQADGTGDVCPATTFPASTGEKVDYMAGLAIINGAHDINVKSSTFQGNTHFSMENGGDTMWFNACTGFFEVIQKKGTPGGGANLDVNGNCYFNQFGFKPVPTKVC